MQHFEDLVSRGVTPHKLQGQGAKFEVTSLETNEITVNSKTNNDVT